MNTHLDPPFLLREYKELIRVEFSEGGKTLVSQQLINNIIVPTKMKKPIVTLQCIDNGGVGQGPVFVYDWIKEGFIEYHEMKEVPKKELKEVAKKVAKELKKEVKKEVKEVMAEFSKPSWTKDKKKAKPSDPVEVEKSPLDLSAKSELELDSQVHAEDPPVDDVDKI